MMNWLRGWRPLNLNTKILWNYQLTAKATRGVICGLWLSQTILLVLIIRNQLIGLTVRFYKLLLIFIMTNKWILFSIVWPLYSSNSKHPFDRNYCGSRCLFLNSPPCDMLRDKGPHRHSGSTISSILYCPSSESRWSWGEKFAYTLNIYTLSCAPTHTHIWS